MFDFNDKTFKKIALFILSIVNPGSFNLNYMCDFFQSETGFRNISLF